MQITMTDIEFNALQQRVRDTEAAAAAAIAERDKLAQDAIRAATTSETFQHFNAAISSAIAVVRFAVANYPPEAVRGWPIEALLSLADALDGIIGIEYDFKALALELRAFAREAQAIETKRKNRPQKTPSSYGVLDEPSGTGAADKQQTRNLE